MGEPSHPGARAVSNDFPLTQWSLVGRAADHAGDEADWRAALSVLLQRYLPALRTYLLVSRRARLDQVDDLLQGFIADKVIEQNLLDRAKKEKGKFRSFLLATLNNYLISQHRMQLAATRSPSATGAMHGLNEAEQVSADAMSDPARQYCVAWAREMVAEALRRMKAECKRGERGDLWAIFHGRIVAPSFEGAEPIEYAKLVEELKLPTPLAACSLLCTAKRMFARNLRSVAQEYTEPGNGSDTEIEELRRILAEELR